MQIKWVRLVKVRGVVGDGVCKLFNQIGSERWLYKKLSLHDVSLEILTRRTLITFKTYDSFMNLCIDYGNT
ncbi:hypothetical protein H5410_051054 [Solanum commersonii]|uniref:Uncharacterized protein n=1 Tax=Solanum commersonii TaxID=4109 RepID=A0A9J5WXA3_SOLCO|nr:hypothetical protein H5410_051054 [Solanum commersonii]